MAKKKNPVTAVEQPVDKTKVKIGKNYYTPVSLFKIQFKHIREEERYKQSLAAKENLVDTCQAALSLVKAWVPDLREEDEMEIEVLSVQTVLEAVIAASRAVAGIADSPGKE